MAELNNIKILLKNRVGFRKPIDESFEALNADNVQSDSGLIFQDAYSMVTILNIKESQPTESITDNLLNTYLVNLRESNVLEVLTDVFKGQSFIDEDQINNDLSVFDKAIYLRMVIKVSELILSSVRDNRNNRLNKNALNLLRLDLNGSNDQGGKNSDLPYHSGFIGRYRREVKYLETMFNNNQSEMLETITLT